MKKPMMTATTLLARTKAANDELRDGLEATRARIAELTERRDELASARVSIEVARRRIDAFVERERAQPLLDSWGADHFTFGQADYRPPEIHDRLRFLYAHLLRVVGEEMKADLDELYGEAPVVDDAKREGELLKLEGELLDCELVEESVIRAAEAAGFPITRRADADVRAVLATADSLP